ncbi:unnamed protein product, partial [Brenthis ino]
MTSDYYFRKWKKCLETLKNLVELDTEYQISKAHDQQICETAQRLNGVLGNYIVSYNEALECLQHNLQIQKTEYIYNIVKTIEARILELKGQLRQLEGSYCQFLTNGLIEHKITPHDTEFSNISSKYERPKNIKILIDEALLKAKEMKEKDVHNIGNKENVKPEDEFLQNFNWWEDQSKVKDEQPKGINITAIYEVKEVISEETLKRKELISLIQTHELTRQVTRRNLYQAQKREIWEEELKGTLSPAAPLPLREKSAKLIQRVVRYEEARFFYDIPKENRGGIVSIIKEEVPSPSEWLDKYETYLEMKKSNKMKTSYQLKWEQQETKEEETKLKREELQKKKLEAELLKKIMKNPTLHPGYHYPMSKKTHNIVEALEQYFESWNDLDKEEIIAVKEKYVKIVDEERLCMEAKIEVCKSVKDDMRTEIKILKKALKDEYLRNGEKMPEQMKKKTQKPKSPRKLKIKQTDNNIFDKLTDLAVKGHLKEYPLTNFEDFLGDLNYAGADRRCALQQTLHFGGESRALWWERCRDVIHGFKRVLLVGPKQSGKTTLVHVMATVNDAVLYELSPAQIEIENLNIEYLQQLVNSITTCAKMTQPSIIYIKYVHKLYWTKAAV